MNCHSERSEESLLGFDPRKEGFLASLGMTIWDTFPETVKSRLLSGKRRVHPRVREAAQ